MIISEDNAPSHLKARQLLAAEIAEQEIEFIDWLSNSPNLHLIKDVQKHYKTYLEDTRFAVDSAAKQVRDNYKEEIRRIWRDDLGFN